MTSILIHCPYGHSGEVTRVKVTKAREGSQDTLTALYGIKCGICGRVFVHERHSYLQTGGVDYVPIGYLHTNDFYEQDGPWRGVSIELEVTP